MPQDKEPWWDIEERRIKESKNPKKRSSNMLKVIVWIIILAFAAGFFTFLYVTGELWFLGL